jgi:hypothetical protein
MYFGKVQPAWLVKVFCVKSFPVVSGRDFSAPTMGSMAR